MREPSMYRVLSLLFVLVLLFALQPAGAQQQDSGGDGVTPAKSCFMDPGASCPPPDGTPKSGTDVDGGGVDDNGDGVIDDPAEQDWKLYEIEDDKMNKIQIWCVDGPPTYYALIFVPPGGGQRVIGKCPFGGGCNSQYKFDDTDADGNGKPDCFTKTTWTSRDEQYGDSDDDGDGNVDWYTYTYDVAKNELWTECWQSPDGEGDADGDGVDEPDELVDECHGPPPEGNFDFEDLKPADPTVANEPTTHEEPAPEEEPLPTTEPTTTFLAGDQAPMATSVDRLRLSGIALGGVVGIELANRTVEVHTEPGQSAASVVESLAAALREKMAFLDVEVEGSELRVAGAAHGELVTFCTDPGIPVPSPVQNLRGVFDPMTSTVHLSWDLPPGARHERIHIFRDGVSYRINRLPSTTEFSDHLDLSMETDAIHEYRIVVEADGVRTAASVLVPILVVREGEPILPEPRSFPSP